MSKAVFRTVAIAGPNYVPGDNFDRDLARVGHWILEALSLAGPITPQSLRWEVKTVSELQTRLNDLVEEVRFIEMPDDYGNFPETMGYNSPKWEELVPELQDEQTYPYMTKAVDAVVEFTNRRWTTLDKIGYRDLGKLAMATRFGGRIFAAIGIVNGGPPAYDTI